MQRGSSVNFQPIQSASHAVSHASRDLPPTYLLPPEHSLGTICVIDDFGQVAKTLSLKLGMASRQALAVKDYSPMWEGVLNLPRPEVEFNTFDYKKLCKTIVFDWCKKYEEMTGHKVLRADIHLDEGHIVEGVAMFNAHAHIMADKTNDRGRVIKLTPQKLRELQTVTAEITKLERGVNSRVSGKKHITAHQYKYLAERGNLEIQKVKAQLDVEKCKTEKLQKLYTQDTSIITKLKSDLNAAELKLATLKPQKKEIQNDNRNSNPQLSQEAPGIITVQDVFVCSSVFDISGLTDTLQRDAFSEFRPGPPGSNHSELFKLDQEIDKPKILNDSLAIAQAEVLILEANVSSQTDQIAKLNKQYRLDIEALEAKYKDDRIQYKASVEKKTLQDYKDLKTDHLNELETQAKAHAQKVKGLEKGLAEAQTEAAKLEAGAVQVQAEINRLTPRAAQVPGLEAQVKAQAADLTTLKPKADRVPQLEKDLTKAKADALAEAAKVASLKAQIDTLTPRAAQVLALVAQKVIDDAALKKVQERFDRSFSLGLGDATKISELEKKVKNMEKEALTQGEKLDVSEGKVEKLTKENIDLAAKAARFATMAENYQAELAKGVAAHLIVPDPVPRTSQSNKQAVLTPAPIPQEATRTALGHPKHAQAATPSVTSRTAQETTSEAIEAVFPRLQEHEFQDLVKKVTIPDRLIEAARDVLVLCLGLVESARKQQVFPAAVTRSIEKLLSNYIAPAAEEPTAPPMAQKATERAFLALHPSLKAVEVGSIDGMRLDAACGRLGVFSMVNAMRTGRVQVLCKVPSGKAMPAIGQCFDSRAVPGQGKGGIAD